MKKFLSLVLSLIILLSLSACTLEKDKAASENKGKKTEKTQTDKKQDSNNKQVKKTKKVKLTAGDLLKNSHARKAIALAIDKKTLVENLTKSAIPVDYLVPENFAYDDEGLDFRKRFETGFLNYNSEKAKKEWKLAKQELNFEKVEVEILTFNGEDAGRINQVIRESLENNLDGISVITNQQSFGQKMEASSIGKFLISLEGWAPDYVDPLAFLELFTKESKHNTGSYNNIEFEKLIKQAKNTLDSKQRIKLLQNAEKILVEDAIIIPLFQDSESYLVRPYIKNLVRNKFNAGFYFKYSSTDKTVEREKLISVLGGVDGAVLDIHKIIDRASISLISNLKEGLLGFDQDGNVKQAIAKNWDVSEDKKEYTFYLRDTKWSNGESVLAKDFVDSWQRLADKKTNSPYATMLETAGIKNAIQVINGEIPLNDLGVRAIDNYTLKVSLDRPVPYFLDLMTFPCFYPINKKFIEQKGEDYASSIDTILYNGAYKINAWDLGYGMELKKNETYWDYSSLANDGVKYRIAKDYKEALALYDNHDIDICNIEGSAIEQRENSPDFVKYNTFSVFYLLLNTDFKN